jgi:ketosteroid isomerase-like protein
MTPTAKQAVLSAWKAFGSGDRPRIQACLAPDVEWLAPPGNATAVALPYTHHMIGREQVVNFLVDEFPRLFVGDVRVDVGTVVAEGNIVVLQERMRARLANGRDYDNDYCFLFTVDDAGRIARVREYMDTRKGHACVFGKD